MVKQTRIEHPFSIPRVVVITMLLWIVSPLSSAALVVVVLREILRPVVAYRRIPPELVEGLDQEEAKLVLLDRWRFFDHVAVLVVSPATRRAWVWNTRAYHEGRNGDG